MCAPASPTPSEMALAVAGERAAGATAYVGLEPCSHHGRTPPCTDALIAAGIARVVVAAVDPDPRVNGSGLDRLRAAGIAVDQADGEIERRAHRQNAGFRTLVTLGRPHVTYKVAVSRDGRTAPASGERTWISSTQSRRLVHELRARAGAVAVGIGTVLADDPDLTARDLTPPAERQPIGSCSTGRRGSQPVPSWPAAPRPRCPSLTWSRPTSRRWRHMASSG